MDCGSTTAGVAAPSATTTGGNGGLGSGGAACACGSGGGGNVARCLGEPSLPGLAACEACSVLMAPDVIIPGSGGCTP